MTNAKRLAMLESTVREFKGVGEAVQTMQTKELPKLFRRTLEWESLNQRVKTLEVNKGVKGSGSGTSLQVEEQLAMIEDNQRQIGDTVKDLTTKVNDVIATLQLEISELATTIKVMMMALGNSSQESGALKRCGKVKVLDPRPYAGEQDVQKLKNFLFNMVQYFLATTIDSKEG